MENLNQWKSEIENYLSELKTQIESNEELKKLCYGFSVIDGKIHNNPEIMFIGINSGKGNRESNLEINIETDECSYLDDYYNYPLRDQNIDLLKLIGYPENEIKEKLQDNFVKTNLFYVDTVSENDLKKFKNKDFFEKSCYFTLGLIKLLQPKVVLFEGKSVYNNIIEDCYEKSGTWDEENGIAHFFDEELNVDYFGFKRSPINNLSYNQNILAEKIKKVLL